MQSSVIEPLIDRDSHFFGRTPKLCDACGNVAMVPHSRDLESHTHIEDVPGHIAGADRLNEDGTLRTHAHEGPVSNDEHRSFTNHLLVRKGLAPVTDWKTVGDIQARIESGHLIVECHCKGAELVSRTQSEYVCSNCRAGPFRVLLPKELV